MAGRSKPATGKRNSQKDTNDRDALVTVEPVSREGPVLTLRVRSSSTVKAIKKAAGKCGMSMNTWCAEVLEQAARAQA